MQNEIKKTWHFYQSPQEVWDYLTKPELLEQWLAKMDFQPVIGHKFLIVGKADCRIYCQVLEVKPFTQLSYSWQTISVYDSTPFNSNVVWTLVEKENGTELQLVHNGFIALEDYTEHTNGWITLVNRLVERLNKIKN